MAEKTSEMGCLLRHYGTELINVKMIMLFSKITLVHLVKLCSCWMAVEGIIAVVTVDLHDDDSGN